jgi:hypothetical protein
MAACAGSGLRRRRRGWRLVVRELANTLITIMRGIEIDEYGDETDVGLTLYQQVPASLVETGHQTFDRASSTRRTIRSITCMIPS